MYTDQPNEDHALNKHKLISAYKNHFDAKLKPVLHEIPSYDKSEGRFEDNGVDKWPTSWWQQFFVLLRRYAKERKHESFSGLRICQVLMASLIAGLLWYKS